MKITETPEEKIDFMKLCSGCGREFRVTQKKSRCPHCHKKYHYQRARPNPSFLTKDAELLSRDLCILCNKRKKARGNLFCSYCKERDIFKRIKAFTQGVLPND